MVAFRSLLLTYGRRPKLPPQKIAAFHQDLGFPTWGMQLPPPMKSFLRQHPLNGKTVIPINTNAGYGVGSSFQTVKELCTQGTILEGFVTRGGIERDGQILVIKEARAEEAKEEVEDWLRKINMLK